MSNIDGIQQTSCFAAVESDLSSMVGPEIYLVIPNFVQYMRGIDHGVCEARDHLQN